MKKYNKVEIYLRELCRRTVLQDRSLNGVHGEELLLSLLSQEHGSEWMKLWCRISCVCHVIHNLYSTNLLQGIKITMNILTFVIAIKI